MFKFKDKRVKIIATLGPASDRRDMTVNLAQAGVDMFRLNCSHRNREESRLSINNIRYAEKLIGRPLAVMGDLAGPKIRIGKVKTGTVLESGKEIIIISNLIEGTEKCFSVNTSKVLANIIPGSVIYLGDGIIKLEVKKIVSGGIRARVIVGGPIRSNMGFSAQWFSLAPFSLSEKDKRDARDMAALGADALAVSFVQHERDIRSVRSLFPKGKCPFLIAKIETSQGVERAEHILKKADGLMVARGDLGLALKIEDLPIVQKDLIDCALKMSKPVITATQMLASMTKNIIPTRAEITDVANAILDGSDAIMLSDETAQGLFPVEVVSVMANIARATSVRVNARSYEEDGNTANAISASVQSVAQHIGARLIIVFTESGVTARRIAKHKPIQPILALSPNLKTVRELSLSWGVSSILTRRIKNLDKMLELAKKIARKNNFYPLKKGELFVISAGVPFGTIGATNLVIVEKA